MTVTNSFRFNRGVSNLLMPWSLNLVHMSKHSCLRGRVVDVWLCKNLGEFLPPPWQDDMEEEWKGYQDDRQQGGRPWEGTQMPPNSAPRGTGQRTGETLYKLGFYSRILKYVDKRAF